MQEHVSQEISRQVRFLTSAAGGGGKEEQQEEKDVKKCSASPSRSAISQCVWLIMKKEASLMICLLFHGYPYVCSIQITVLPKFFTLGLRK
jgi:hypothetical protein